MGHVYNIKKQFKVQIIVILEEIYSFYWPKMHLWKGDKNFGQGPSSPSFGQNPKEQIIFFVKPSLIDQFIFIDPLNQFWVIATWWCDETGRGHAKAEYSWKFFPPADKALISQAVKKSKVFSNFLFQIIGMFSMSVVVWNVRIFLSQMVCTSFE